MKRSLVVLVLVVAVLLVGLGSAGNAAYWQRYLAAVVGTDAEAAASRVQPRLLVAGAPEDAPRASAEAAMIAPEALAAAEERAEHLGLRALVVHRRAHRVLEHFAPGTAGRSLVAGGELSAAPFALALGVLVDTRRVGAGAAVDAVRTAADAGRPWRNPWSEGARRRFSLAPAPEILQLQAEASVSETLARRVWQPLRAGDAWLWGVDDTALRVDCCMVAAVDDWIRVADLLTGQGSYQGERIASADWIRHLLAVDADGQAHPVWISGQQGWSGDEPPAARDAFWFDLADDLRLWLVPRRGLVVLVWGSRDTARDTLIPNIIIRGLQDQAPPVSGSDLQQIVPGH